MLDLNVLKKKRDLVIDRLVHLGGADYSKDKEENSLKKFGLVERDFGIEEWDWPQGVGLMGLDEAGGNDAFLNDWFEKNFSKGLPSRNINTTLPFYTLLHLANRTGKPSYRAECHRQAEYLVKELPRTKERGFQHVTSAVGSRTGTSLNSGQLWIDTIFMSVLFLNEYGEAIESRTCTDESIYQVLLHIKYLYDKQCGLFFHGWSFERNDNFGAVHWARGNSWFTLAMPIFLSQNRHFPLPEGVKEYLKMTLRAQIRTLIPLQASSGLWHTVLDDPTSYEEASASAAIASGIYRATKEGIIDDEYLPVADKAIEGLLENILPDGTVDKVSAGTAIGMDNDFYKKIIIRPMAYGQALTLLALNDAMESIGKRR